MAGELGKAVQQQQQFRRGPSAGLFFKTALLTIEAGHADHTIRLDCDLKCCAEPSWRQFNMNASSDFQPLLRPGTFDGKTVVVTGGGTGLGKAMARCLMLLGANLVICGRRKEVLDSAASELREETGGDVLGVPCDVRIPEQVENLLAEATLRFGQTHALVNNAAGNFICPTERLSYNAFNTVVDIVLRGTANCTLAFGKQWIAKGSGGTVLNIVATGDIAGTQVACLAPGCDFSNVDPKTLRDPPSKTGP